MISQCVGELLTTGMLFERGGVPGKAPACGPTCGFVYYLRDL